MFNYSLISVTFAFESIYERISNSENHLFGGLPIGEIYSKESFDQIKLKLKICMEMLDKAKEDVQE